MTRLPAGLGRAGAPGRTCTFHPQTTEPATGLDWASVSLPARAALYRTGQVADRVFVIRSGIVEVIVTLPNGRTRILGLHGPGAVLGMGLALRPHQHGRYPHTALAIRPLEAGWVFATTLQRLRGSSPADYLALLERQCAELRRSERWIAEFAADRADSRLARLVIYLAELQGRAADTRVDAARVEMRGGARVELLTCREMGEAVGVSAETASRVLADFKRSRVLVRDPGGGRSRYRFDGAALQSIAFP